LSDIIPTAPEPRPLPFRRPADYYAAPLSEVRPIFPRWVPLGCGAASLVALLVLFAGGAIFSGAKGGALFAMLFTMMRDEVRGMYAKDVTAAQKLAFDAEMKIVLRNLDQGKVSIDQLQPLLQTIRETSMDSSVSGGEVEKLTKAARDMNEKVAKLPGSAVSESPHPATAQPRNPATR
jgi:hypothetical protein